MTLREEHALTIAEIVRDAVAAGDAALARDFEEARFRTQLAAAKADRAGLAGVAFAAALLLEALGDPGSIPEPGYGEAMNRLAIALDAVGFDPL
ncbi:hypothetical protein [Luteibacter sp. UNC138MFCol5.1]|uniref:hypothetical protein n=1 Tax=Luteibacter sp. UNC138MFCol5.1 TaxID=1502774 RepID=UPI000B7F5EFF|nr:hypothetical protein [Luteibacter sp. UNC138MFCol5.1]